MNRLIVVFAGLVMISNGALAQFRLDIEIIKIRNNTGNLMLQLLDEKEKVVAQEIGQIANGSCSFSLKNLKPGRYAVRYFHDENMNGILDKSIIGKPTEGYGFSNNVTGKFGPPPFEKWLFDITGDKKISLIPTY